LTRSVQDDPAVDLASCWWHFCRSWPPEKRFRGNVFALKLENRRNGLEIGPDTPIPLWNGESMNYGMAVEVLLEMENGPPAHGFGD
jgi:hypothetical protein